jgi:hypothetical protein
VRMPAVHTVRQTRVVGYLRQQREITERKAAWRVAHVHGCRDRCKAYKVKERSESVLGGSQKLSNPRSSGASLGVTPKTGRKGSGRDSGRDRTQRSRRHLPRRAS